MNILELEKEADHIISFFDSYKTLYFRLLLRNGNLSEYKVTKVTEKNEIIYSHTKRIYVPKKDKKIINLAQINYSDLIISQKEDIGSFYSKNNTIKNFIVELRKMDYIPFY